MPGPIVGDIPRLTASSLLVLPNWGPACRLHFCLRVPQEIRNIVRLCTRERVAVAVVNEYRRLARQHIVRVRAEVLSSAFFQVSGIRPVRGRAWKCRVVRPCCRRRCRQTATRMRSVEWSLAGVLFGLGSGMVRGPYAGPATRAGFAPARNLNEWPPGLARRGPRPEQVGKAHGADRLTHELRTGQRPAAASPSTWPSPWGNVRVSSRFWSSAALSLRGLVAGRPAVAEPRAGRVGGRAARDPRQRVALKTYRKFGRTPLRRYAVVGGRASGCAAGLVRWSAGCGSCSG